MISVLVACHNGASTIGRTLEALSQLQEPRGGWRLIAVDNGSTDTTASILAQYRARLPLTCLFEPTLGKNHALNRGLQHLEGDLAVFTDDDVIPDPDWLVRIKACADAHPEYDVIGGAILPVWPRQPPEWILESVPLGQVFGASNPSQTAGEISPHLVWGANMTVRMRVFRDGFQFDTRFGPNGTTRYVTGSETQFALRVAEAGYRFWFCPAIRVGHIIREEQFELRSILQRAFRSGRLQVRLEKHAALRSGAMLFGVPMKMWGGCARRSLDVLLTAVTAGWPSQVRARFALAEACGRFVESHRMLTDVPQEGCDGLNLSQTNADPRFPQYEHP